MGHLNTQYMIDCYSEISDVQRKSDSLISPGGDKKGFQLIGRKGPPAMEGGIPHTMNGRVSAKKVHV